MKTKTATKTTAKGKPASKSSPTSASKSSPARATKPKASPLAADLTALADLDFVPMLVHELRTPLTALRGSLGLLAGAVEDAGPEVQNFASIADRNANKLAAMLDEAAEHSRLNDPATTLSRERTDIVDTVQRAIEQVQALIDERGIVVDVKTTPADASADPALLRVGVVRLLSYALRVSPQKSTVYVRVDTVNATGAASGRPRAKRASTTSTTIVISVSDGGKVIPAESAARMFDPFSTVARRSVEPAGRTGLGLAIAQKIAQLHAGSLVFTSTEHGGLFTLRLPA